MPATTTSVGYTYNLDNLLTGYETAGGGALFTEQAVLRGH